MLSLVLAAVTTTHLKMFRCMRCNAEFNDGAQCSGCQGHLDFACAGITEGGYRRLGGDRRNNWKCLTCKSSGTASPRNPVSGKTPPISPISPNPVDMEVIVLELKRLTAQMATLPELMTSLKAIQADIADLKSVKSDIANLKLLKPEVAELKKSVEFVQNSVQDLTNRVSDINEEVQTMVNAKNEVSLLKQKFESLETAMQESEQRTRLNNIEIKGVPFSQTENLYDVVGKIGDLINCTIPKNQINYVVRVPMRNDKQNKSIIVAVHSRYLKEDFVAAAKKRNIVPADLGLRGDIRIYVNDHLTVENKLLLNKAKSIAKERGFTYLWVKGCKIFARKNPTSHAIAIRTESDLKKLA